MKKIDKLDIMARVNSFPSMPGAAVKLLNLMDDQDTDVSQVEGILRYDPGLTANVLRLTNSSYFGFPSKVGSIRHAVILLGLKRIAQLVITSCVNAVMGKAVPGYDLPSGELWRHSIAVSVAAEGLAKELKLPADDEIFTAALLHDVGKMVLGAFLKQDLKEIEIAASRGIPFEMAEQEVLGTDHAEIGAEILKNWSLPQEIVSAVRWHHAPESAPEANVLIDLVHVADVLCLMIGIGVGIEGLQYEPSPLATKRLGLKAAHLEVVASNTLQWISELTDELEM
ncbi:MAG TPA: histidine kinase [Desulfobacteraceae bacterium]|nr:histidine kinase [Desulfobacteraceae bacterium]